MPGSITQVERLARMEAELEAMKESLSEHKAETKAEFEKMNNKLDDLLVLRHKGVGAFWLASSLFGTGIAGALFSFFGWNN
jgi:hypothetical protein